MKRASRTLLALFAVPAVALLSHAVGGEPGAGTPTALAALQKVRALHTQAHLERDAGLLVSTFADDFVSIQDGEVTHPSREESLARFRTYFERSEIVAWEDIEPPVIHLSDDGTMAGVVVRKRVATRPAGGSPAGAGEEAAFSWLEIWKKSGGDWKLNALASTRK